MLKIKNRVLVVCLAVLSVLVTSCSQPIKETSNEIVTMQNEMQTDVISKETILTEETTNPSQQEESMQNSNQSTSVTVHFIDTGNSDSILISDNGKYMIIDGADNNDEEMLVDYINDLNIKKIDYVVLTHPDADHSGGLDAVIRNFEIGQVFVGNGDADTKTYKDFINEAIRKKLQPSVPLSGKTFQLGEGTFTFYNQESTFEDVNDNSLITLFTFGDTKFLFMGDAGKEVERQLPLDKIGKVDVLKVGHHGSKTSSAEEFIKSIAPTYSIICAGRDNKYGHPHQVTLDTIEKYGSMIYRTDTHGTIFVESNGREIKVSSKGTNSHYVPKENKQRENSQVSKSNVQNTISANEGLSADKQDQKAEEHSETVFVTSTGKKYHKDGCTHLKKSKIPISIQEAKAQGYEPCSICYP